MELNFVSVLQTLGLDAAFRIANAARAGAEYLFASLLPEVPRTDYNVSSGNMTIRPTMAGLVGMDSPYPPGGSVTASTFLENSAKIANQVPLNEQTLRQLQQLAAHLRLTGGDSNAALAENVLNFITKVIVQPHLDTAEWLRAQCLVNGAIDWTFGKITLTVDYGVPAENMLTGRTGTDAWDSTASKFWADVALLRRRLRGPMRALIVAPTTADAIVYNPANGGVVVGEAGGGAIRTIQFRRYAQDTTGAVDPRQFSQDAREALTLLVYSGEAEVIDPTDPASTVIVPFMPDGKMLAVGTQNARGFIVGQGATEDPNLANRLGYTHIAPTVEGGGRPGRWARVYTPEGQPWSLNGQGVTNLLPVLEAPDQVAVATSLIGGV